MQIPKGRERQNISHVLLHPQLFAASREELGAKNAVHMSHVGETSLLPPMLHVNGKLEWEVVQEFEPNTYNIGYEHPKQSLPLYEMFTTFVKFQNFSLSPSIF